MESLQYIFSVLVGAGIALFCVKFIIASWLKRIDALPDKLAAIASKITAINVKLEVVDDLVEQIRVHDRKIAGLEAYYAAASKKRTPRPYREDSQ